MLDLRKSTPLRLKYYRETGIFFGKAFLHNIQQVPFLSPCAVIRVPNLSPTFALKRIYAQRLSTKFYSRIARHQQSADQEAQSRNYLQAINVNGVPEIIGN